MLSFFLPCLAFFSQRSAKYSLTRVMGTKRVQGWWGISRRGSRKNPLPGSIGERAVAIRTFLVVQVSFRGSRLVEVARWTNGVLAGIRPRKPGGLVPIEMVDRIRVLGVGLGQFAGEDLGLLLEPSLPQGRDLILAIGCGRARSVTASFDCQIAPKPGSLLTSAPRQHRSEDLQVVAAPEPRIAVQR